MVIPSVTRKPGCASAARPVPPRILIPPAPHRFDDDRLRRRAPLAGLPGPGHGRPGGPLRDHIAFLAGSSWLLRARLSGGAELTYRGRTARQLRVTPAPGGEEVALGPLRTYATDAIVDAETGCLLRLISYAGDTLAIWSELDDISTMPIDPDEFPVYALPGTRTVEETGNLIADAAAVMPGVKGTAARAVLRQLSQ